MEKYIKLLEESLVSTKGRDSYSSIEVRDLLLDLWLAIEEEKPELELASV